jgi:large subunit ribosomal protein L4
MAVASYTKTGSKSTTPVKLDKQVFGQEVTNHQLLKDVYLSYLANGRTASAKTKSRGMVRGGGRKPWRQKGLGRARFGSSRNPIWRGGGVAFGPTGEQNYKHKINTQLKRQALRQALSLAAKEDRLKVVDSLTFTDGKTKSAVAFLAKVGAEGRTLIVVGQKEDKTQLALRNLPDTKLTAAKQLNVYDILNADWLVIEKPALEAINKWLNKTAKEKDE